MKNKKRPKVKKYLVVERYILDDKLTPELEKNYANLYGRIVMHSADIFKGYHLYCLVDLESKLAII